MRSALVRETLAAWVVRTFAMTAMRMPMNPAESEQKAPTTNPIAVEWSLKMKSRMKMMTAITLMVTTWRFRHAFAPSSTAPEISRILSLPAGARDTIAIRTNAKIRPMAAHNIDSCTPESSRVRARKAIALTRDKAHDCIKISDTGKAYLPRRENVSDATAFLRTGCGRGS